MSATSAAAKTAAKVGRNDPCPCGSGRKYERCCQARDAGAEGSRRDRPLGFVAGRPYVEAQALALMDKAHGDAGQMGRCGRVWSRIAGSTRRAPRRTATSG